MQKDIDTHYKALDDFTKSVPNIINEKYMVQNEKFESVRGKISNQQIRIDELLKKQINL